MAPAALHTGAHGAPERGVQRAASAEPSPGKTAPGPTTTARAASLPRTASGGFNAFAAGPSCAVGSPLRRKAERCEPAPPNAPSALREAGATAASAGECRPALMARPPLQVSLAAPGAAGRAGDTSQADGLAGLKRKRPPQLAITTDICTHAIKPGAALPSAPSAAELREINEDEVGAEGLTYGASSKRGRRHLSMEDAYAALPDVHGDPSQAIFSVFDGHGGRAAADYACDHLHDAILAEVERGASVGDAVRAGYAATDAAFLSEGVSSGAAAVTALIKDGVLWVGNAGDCRAVLCRGGAAEPLTRDHRPDRPDERARIEGCGGEVVNTMGTWRVQGVLGVSRAFGDRDLKQYISAEPEVSSTVITSECEFLLLGSDGVWDAVGNQEAVELVRQALLPACDVSATEAGEPGESPDVGPSPVLSGDGDSPEGSTSSGPSRKRRRHVFGAEAACRKLVNLARTRGSRDDISVLLIDLTSYLQEATDAS